MVAPARLQRGLSDLLPATRSAAGNLVAESGWLRGLRDAWDASGSWWRERVVNFNAGTQRDLLSWLGLGNIDYRGMALLLLAGATLWALVLLALLRRRAHAHTDALGRIWQRYLALLQRRGLPIADHEGPEAIRHRAMRAWPEAGDAIERLTRGYEALRFGTPDPARWQGTLPDLRRQLRLVARRAVRR
jgi:hypothetical protein